MTGNTLLVNYSAHDFQKFAVFKYRSILKVLPVYKYINKVKGIKTLACIMNKLRKIKDVNKI